MSRDHQIKVLLNYHNMVQNRLENTIGSRYLKIRVLLFHLTISVPFHTASQLESRVK